MRGRGSVSIFGCPELNIFFFFFDGLKVNLISINQICDSKLSVRFSQALHEVFNKEELTLIGHRTMDYNYTVNSNSNSSLVVIRPNLMLLRYGIVS